MSKLYVAYGSNLNLMQMGWRCPSAKVVGKGFIRDYKLIFNGVATIVPEEKKTVPVAVWKIEDSDEKALDRYEGYPTLYRKEKIKVEMEDKDIEGMVYIMNRGIPHLPAMSYLHTIIEGYSDIGFDTQYLEEAVKETKKLM